MIFLTPITWEFHGAPIKVGVTACHQKVFPFMAKEIKNPRRVVLMWAHAVLQENL